MSPATFIVTCHACGTGNRIPTDREGLRGRCRQLSGAHPLDAVLSWFRRLS